MQNKKMQSLQIQTIYYLRTPSFRITKLVRPLGAGLRATFGMAKRA